MPLANPALTEFTTASPSIVSYNYTDIANGEGSNIYYLAETEAAATDYILTPHTIHSAGTGVIELSSTTMDRDYDLSPFTLPQTISGTGFFSINAYLLAGANSSVTVTVYKYDGSAESAISSAINIQNWSVAGSSSEMLLLPIPLTETQFEVGDVLRVRFQAGITGTVMKLGQDPAGRTNADVDITTRAQLIIPYKLNL